MYLGSDDYLTEKDLTRALLNYDTLTISLK